MLNEEDRLHALKKLLSGKRLAEVEALLYQATLDHCEWNRTKAAKILGVCTRTVYAKVKDLGLFPSRDVRCPPGWLTRDGDQ